VDVTDWLDSALTQINLLERQILLDLYRDETAWRPAISVTTTVVTGSVSINVSSNLA